MLHEWLVFWFLFLFLQFNYYIINIWKHFCNRIQKFYVIIKNKNIPQNVFLLLHNYYNCIYIISYSSCLQVRQDINDNYDNYFYFYILDNIKILTIL